MSTYSSSLAWENQEVPEFGRSLQATEPCPEALGKMVQLVLIVMDPTQLGSCVGSTGRLGIAEVQVVVEGVNVAPGYTGSGSASSGGSLPIDSDNSTKYLGNAWSGNAADGLPFWNLELGDPGIDLAYIQKIVVVNDPGRPSALTCYTIELLNADWDIHYTNSFSSPAQEAYAFTDFIHPIIHLSRRQPRPLTLPIAQP